MTAAIWIVAGVLGLVNMALWLDRAPYQLPRVPLIAPAWELLRFRLIGRRR